jgi:uncharacterized protein with GYD domain
MDFRRTLGRCRIARVMKAFDIESVAALSLSVSRLGNMRAKTLPTVATSVF